MASPAVSQQTTLFVEVLHVPCINIATGQQCIQPFVKKYKIQFVFVSQL